MTTPHNIWTAPAMGGGVTRLPCCIPFCRRTTKAKNGLFRWRNMERTPSRPTEDQSNAIEALKGDTQ